MQLIRTLDHAVTDFLRDLVPHTAFFDTIFTFLSIHSVWIYVWLAVFIMYVVWQERRNRAFLIYFCLAVALSFLMTNVLIKNLVGRSRPWVSYRMTNTVCPTDYSFPSSHASTAFAAATICAVFDRKRRAAYFAVASAIAYSRIYLSCHYMLDITAGAFVGVAMSAIVVHTMSYSKKFLKKGII